MAPVEVRGGELVEALPASLLGQCVGNHQLVQYLGSGAMGTVYLARHVRIGQEVAIKVLHRTLAADPTLVRRFEQEARAVARTGHRNVPQIFDFGELGDGRSYFVMEYLRGRSLGKLLEQKPVLAPGLALGIAREVALALRAAHQAGVVHRDLKPENIFVLDEDPLRPAAKVLDFGIAKLQGGGGGAGGAGGNAGGARLTKIGLVQGTPQYIAPEQVEDAPDLDGRADLYALGVVMFEMLCGERPFVGETAELLVHHMRTEPPDPRARRPELPEPVAKIVLRCLSKRPAQRYRDADALIAAIDAADLRALAAAAARAAAAAAAGAGAGVGVGAGVEARGRGGARRAAREALVSTPVLAAVPATAASRRGGWRGAWAVPLMGVAVAGLTVGALWLLLGRGGEEDRGGRRDGVDSPEERPPAAAKPARADDGDDDGAGDERAKAVTKASAGSGGSPGASASPGPDPSTSASPSSGARASSGRDAAAAGISGAGSGSAAPAAAAAAPTSKSASASTPRSSAGPAAESRPGSARPRTAAPGAPTAKPRPPPPRSGTEDDVLRPPF